MPALRGTLERVEVATAGVERPSGQLHYRLRLTRRLLGEPDEVLWADSGSCPAVRPTLATLADLPPPRLSVPGVESEPQEIVLDGVGYELRAPARFGR